MPRLSAWTIHASFVYLILGFTIGGLMLANKGIPFNARMWSLLPAHIEFLFVGWTVQIVFGVAFWILPRFSREPRRGNESIAWFAIVLLNLGIWLAGIAPIFSISAWFMILGIIAQVVGAIAFALYAWPRIKPTGA
jgi:hypothetical protein